MSEGRGGYAHSVAGTDKGAIVTWLEQRAPEQGFGPDDAKQVFALARTFDASLAPSGAAVVVGKQAAVDAYANGVVALALTDGTRAAAHCEWAAFAGKLDCELRSFDGGAGAKASYDVAGPGPTRDRLSAAVSGSNVLLALPDFDAIEILHFATKSKSAVVRRDPTGAKESGLDAPALAIGKGDQSFLAWRFRGATSTVEASWVTTGKERKTLSRQGDVGAPAVTADDDRAFVAFAERAKPGDPYALAWTEWPRDAEPKTVTLSVSSLSVVAPSIAASSKSGCVTLAWVEGSGRATVAKASRVCGGAVEAARTVTISAPGVESGDAKLSADGHWVAWQELPAKGPAELRLAKLSCD